MKGTRCLALPLVVFAAWKRPYNLSPILTALSAQTARSFRVVVWNNHPRLRGPLDGLWRRFDRRLQMTVVHSPVNEYGFGRFRAAAAFAGDPVIFFDDDQIPRRDFVAGMTHLYRHYGPGTVLSAWCRAIDPAKGYWGSPLVGPGEYADYGGTGGMAISREVFTDRFVRSFPARFKPVEDIYLSWWAKRQGRRIRCIGARGDRVQVIAGARLDLHPDDRESFPRLRSLKETCTRWCLRHAWPLEREP